MSTSVWIIAETLQKQEHARKAFGTLQCEVRLMTSERAALSSLDGNFPEIVLLCSDLRKEAALNVLVSIMFERDPQKTLVIFWADYGEHDIALEARNLRADVVWEGPAFHRDDILTAWDKIFAPA